MQLPFSDTTVKNGIIQGIERWTNIGDAGISGDATLLKQFTAEVNESFDELMPDILKYLRGIGFDDSNQTGIPIKKSNIVSGTGSYSFTVDDNSVNIISISSVAILPTATATEYVILDQISGDDENAPLYLSPNSLQSGVPTSCLIQGGKVFFDVVPNYSATNGIKAFVNREQYQFVSSDTTKKAGLPSPFHPLLIYLSAQRWLSRNGGVNPELEKLIVQGKRGLKAFIAQMNESRTVMTMKGIRYI